MHQRTLSTHPPNIPSQHLLITPSIDTGENWKMPLYTTHNLDEVNHCLSNTLLSYSFFHHALLSYTLIIHSYHIIFLLSSYTLIIFLLSSYTLNILLSYYHHPLSYVMRHAESPRTHHTPSRTYVPPLLYLLSPTLNILIY